MNELVIKPLLVLIFGTCIYIFTFKIKKWKGK